MLTSSTANGFAAESYSTPVPGKPAAGTPPEGKSRPADSCRWVIVEGGGNRFLYVPETQRMFDVPEQVAAALAAVDHSGTDLERATVKAIVGDLVANDPAPLLSQKRHSGGGLKSAVIHVSQTCNLDCAYCYATDLNKANQTMSREVAAQVVQRTLQMSSNGLQSVKFLGGEPTLAWPTIEFLVRDFERDSQKRNWTPPSFVMVTNGTRLNRAMLDFMAARTFHVLVSIDGDQEIHDQLRPRKGGRGSYDQASRTVRALAEAGIDTAIEAVYTRRHYEAGVTPSTMIRHYLDLGIDQFQISLAVGTWHNEDLIADIDSITELFETATRESVRSFMSDKPYLLRGIQFVLDGFALREKRSHVCGAGRDFMAINYDGEAFPCYLLEAADTSYGFISDHQWDEERYRDVSRRFVCNGKDYHSVCRGCWANEICQSCLGPSFQISPEISKPPAWFCQFQKSLIAATLGEIAAARSSADWDTFLRNMHRHLAPLLRATASAPKG